MGSSIEAAGFFEVGHCNYKGRSLVWLEGELCDGNVIRLAIPELYAHMLRNDLVKVFEELNERLNRNPNRI